MVKCEKCLYRKNCQFLSKSKKAIVEDCTVFKSEEELKSEAIKEFAERLKVKTSWCFSEVFVHKEINNLVKEMTGETKTDTDFPKDYSYGY